MNRNPPRIPDDAIDLYIRTYTSLLRSSGDVPVRAFEEAHLYSDSSLHEGARSPSPDVAAFAYSAGRLPSCMPQVRRIVLGQSHEHFESAGVDVTSWPTVRTRGRRRPLRWDGQGTLAVFVTSVSDIDDLVPIVTAWQIEWNKLHRVLSATDFGRRLATDAAPTDPIAVQRALGMDVAGYAVLREALSEDFEAAMRAIAARESDLTIRMLAGTWSQYQRASQRWWSGIEPVYLREEQPRRRPVYIVSSNTHSMVNLVGGYAHTHREQIFQWARERDFENLAAAVSTVTDEQEALNLSYYLLRAYLHDPQTDQGARRKAAQAFDAESGIRTIQTPGRIDVAAQVIELASLKPERLDPRVRPADPRVIAGSEAVILNIDYPLGLAAYHHLARMAQGVGEIRGIYVMGKAATLNARVGDVLISSVVFDGHSRNTYLFKNAFTAADVQPYLRTGSVLDNQKAVTVRGAYLQNRDTLGAFYREGYTALEMEAGPYLSGVHEIVSPTRHPDDELVHLSNVMPFDLGILHYASDTPYSRRQSLLSKSLSYFGIDSTYACTVAILRRIFAVERAIQASL